MKRLFALTAILAVAATVALTGCGRPHTHEHEPTVAIPATLPGEICVVSGDKLGSMGDPVDYTHQGNTIRLCCAHCIEAFEKDPAKYVAALKAGKAPATHAPHHHDNGDH
jgi:YHS domain-containing protein